MGLDDSLGDGQAEPGAGVVRRAALGSRPPPHIEDPREVRSLDPAATIGDRHLDTTVVRSTGGDHDRALARGVPNGVPPPGSSMREFASAQARELSRPLGPRALTINAINCHVDHEPLRSVPERVSLPRADVELGQLVHHLQSATVGEPVDVTLEDCVGPETLT